jgi:NAD(P)-dependent dehydrogenase (short-subunit alcohol dehydrogenase family)
MSIPKFDITGQKVLIVGGGRGIGKGIALAFAEAGADVAVSALTPTGVSKVAEEVQAMGRKALALTGDATKAADHGPGGAAGAAKTALMASGDAWPNSRSILKALRPVSRGVRQ